MKKEYQLLIALLRQAVAGKGTGLPEDPDWAAFEKLVRSHALEPLVYDGLSAHPRIPQALLNRLEIAYNRAVFKDTQLDYMRMQITEALNARNVKHIFLKGSSLKHDYPVPALRTMCDMDILVHAEDFDTIRQAMLELGGKPAHEDGNHRNYSFPQGVAVEFHPNLIHCASPVAAGINPGWQYACPQPDSGEMQMTQEGFYLNVLCHLADHFVRGGVGVRFVLDVWVCRHLRQPQPDRAFVEKELKRFGLLDFAKKIETLAEAWFGDEPMTEELEELSEYIMTSGSHGMSERAMLNAVCLSPGGSGPSALLKKVFYPRQEMEDRFTWVRGKPWLLPVAWVVRACKAVTKHGDLIADWTKGTMKYSDEEVSTQREKLKRFGVKYGKGEDNETK